MRVVLVIWGVVVLRDQVRDVHVHQALHEDSDSAQFQVPAVGMSASRPGFIHNARSSDACMERRAGAARGKRTHVVRFDAREADALANLVVEMQELMRLTVHREPAKHSN